MPSEPQAPFEQGRTSVARPDRQRVNTTPARVLGWSGAALALLALAIGLKPLFVCGCSLVLLRLLASAWAQLGIRGLQVSRTLAQHRVVEGDSLDAVIELRGRHARSVGAQIEDPVTNEQLSASSPGWRRTGPRTLQRRIVTVAPRRGLHKLQPPTLSVEDPFGLARMTSTSSAAPDEVLVLPRAEAVEWTGRGWRAVTGDREAGQAVFGAGEVDGIRDYQAGTPATRIYWQSLASGQALQERRLIGAAETRPTLILDSRGEHTQAGEDNLDAAVRATASLARSLASRGGCRVQIPGMRNLLVIAHGLHGWEALRTELARVELRWLEQSPPSLRPESLHGPVVYVSAAAVPVPRSLLRSKHPVVQVLPLCFSAPHEGGRLLEVAGCAGYALRQRQSAGQAAA